MTNRLIAHLLSLAAALAALHGLSACHRPDVGEDPVTEPEPVALTLSFQLSSEFTDIEATRNDADAAPLSLRACIYKETEPKPSATPVATLSALVAGLQSTASASLVPGTYTVLAWAGRDDFWDASDFDRIAYSPGQHFDESALAFQCRSSFSVTEESTGAAFTLTPPMARLSIVAADCDAVDLRDFRCRLSYTQFFPSAFSLFSNEPVDSETGVARYGVATDAPESGEREIGADYILVNGHETTLPLRIEILDATGETVKSYAVSAPLLRGRQTTIRGNFFTGASSSGASLDPSFDGGDYNIDF